MSYFNVKFLAYIISSWDINVNAFSEKILSHMANSDKSSTIALTTNFVKLFIRMDNQGSFSIIIPQLVMKCMKIILTYPANSNNAPFCSGRGMGVITKRTKSAQLWSTLFIHSHLYSFHLFIDAAIIEFQYNIHIFRPTTAGRIKTNSLWW